MYIEVTRYAVLKERRMVSHNVSEGVEPRNMFVALGQGVQRRHKVEQLGMQAKGYLQVGSCMQEPT
jgi:hypothetical protein